MLWREEEQASLRQSLRTLQTQYATERARREESEREAELLAGENAALEQQVTRMEGCQVCQGFFFQGFELELFPIWFVTILHFQFLVSPQICVPEPVRTEKFYSRTGQYHFTSGLQVGRCDINTL